MKASVKIWSTPELVILTRSKSEETVLTVCKGDGNIFSSASANDGCWLNSTDSCNEINLS
jgi:hypothetical protein